MNYSIIRCICALVIGVLLVAWPEAAILYLVITIGVLFLVPGLFSVFGYLIRGKQDGSSFPIAGLGSLLFGLWLMIMPAFFVGILILLHLPPHPKRISMLGHVRGKKRKLFCGWIIKEDVR